MTTHRAIQVNALLEIIRLKAAGHRIAASNLNRIGNFKGSAFQLAKAQKCDRIALFCCDRIEKDEQERAPRDTQWAHERQVII